MADMPSDFWGGWIVVLTVTSLLGLTWALFSVYFSANGEKEESPIWDDTLEEGANAPPMWWFWLVFATLIFTVVYLILYPGLGSFSGALRWSQGGHLEESESRIIRNLFRFKSLNAADIMTPRTVIQGMPSDSTIDEAVEQTHSWPFSRIPGCP